MGRRIRNSTRIVVPRNRMAEAMFNNKKMAGYAASATESKDRIERKHDNDWKDEVYEIIDFIDDYMD